jgi:hypothetical protein
MLPENKILIMKGFGIWLKNCFKNWKVVLLYFTFINSNIFKNTLVCAPRSISSVPQLLIPNLQNQREERQTAFLISYILVKARLT